MGIAELLTAINGQSSVPVSETELKDALRMLGSEITINWTARTVQVAVDPETGAHQPSRVTVVARYYQREMASVGDIICVENDQCGSQRRTK